MDAGAWLKKVICVRGTLIRKRKGRMTLSMLEDYDFVSRNVKANRYNHSQALHFIYRHSAKIQNIIPGGKTNEKYQKEFYQLLQGSINARMASSGFSSDNRNTCNS